MENRLKKRQKSAIKLPQRKKWNGELIYIFKNVYVDCILNPEVYSESDRKKILSLLRTLTKEVWIDRTYVEFDGTKFEKTFLLEEGWNALRDLVVDTDFGKKCTKRQSNMMDHAFRSILPGYFEMIFEDLGWDVDNIEFEIIEDAPIDVEYVKDTAEDWKRYPGKWQTWKNA